MKDAIAKFLVFSAAVLGFVVVSFVAQEFFYFPRNVATACGVLAMGVMIKPLTAPDIPMHRWVIAPLAATAIVLIVMTAPQWYERWTAPDRWFPAFLPTEEDFIGQAKYHAEGGSEGRPGPRNCGTFHGGDDTSTGKECVATALAAGEPFYLLYYPQGIDSIIAVALSYSGANHPRVFWYQRDFSGFSRPRAHLRDFACPEPRFLQGPDLLAQCGPWPTSGEFRQEIRVGKDCGSHVLYHDVPHTHRQGMDCAVDAIDNRIAFHYRFDTDFGGETGIVRGALSWNPSNETSPVLSYYFGTGGVTDRHPILMQRLCPAPRFRLVRPRSGDWRQDGSDTSVEVDCGLDLPSR